jgi:hypothetical protein
MMLLYLEIMERTKKCLERDLEEKKIGPASKPSRRPTTS